MSFTSFEMRKLHQLSAAMVTYEDNLLSISSLRIQVYEWDDSRNEQNTFLLCKRVLEPLGAIVLGVYGYAQVTYQVQRAEIGGMLWDVALLDTGEYLVPQTVYNRLVNIRNEGIHFKDYIWMEEIYPDPLAGVEGSLFIPNSDKRPLYFRPIPDEIDRMKEEVLELPSPRRRRWEEEEERIFAEPDFYTSEWQYRKDTWGRRIDPMLIGIVETAPFKGVWTILGKWFHH